MQYIRLLLFYSVIFQSCKFQSPLRHLFNTPVIRILVATANPGGDDLGCQQDGRLSGGPLRLLQAT